jgi:hypothetical protein
LWANSNANNNADWQPVSNGHSYVHAYADSPGHCYTYSASYGYTYS